MMPTGFEEHEMVVLDVVPGEGVGVVCDARELLTLPGGEFDVIWASHFLEHVTSAELSQVLAGFRHVLKDDGRVFVLVPDIVRAFEVMRSRKHDLLDTFYEAGTMPVSYADVIYGSQAILTAGHPFYKHHYGFSENSLGWHMQENGFAGAVHHVHYDLLYVGSKGVYAREACKGAAQVAARDGEAVG